jgi:hypothetical protein
VPRVGRGHRCARLDLEAEDTLSAEFGDDVDLAPAVLVAKMVEARPGGAYLELATQLLGHERVDDPAEQLAVVQDRLHVRPQDGGHQPGIHDIALGRGGEPLEPVRPPGGKRLDDEDVLEDSLIGNGCPPVDPGRLVDALGFGDPGRVERVCLQVAR